MRAGWACLFSFLLCPPAIPLQRCREVPYTISFETSEQFSFPFVPLTSSQCYWGNQHTQSCCLWVGYKITSPVDPVARLGYQLPIASLIPEQMRSLSKVPHSLCSTTSLNNSSCVIIQHSTLIKQDKKIKRYKNLHKHSLNCTTILLVNCISFFDLYFYLFKGARSWLLQDLWTL